MDIASAQSRWRGCRSRDIAEKISAILHPGRETGRPPADASIGSRLVFPSSTGIYRNKTIIGNALTRACKAARLLRVTCHPLQH